MGLGVLLRLLASLQILPRLVSPAALLPAPTVIADPQHPMYFPRERLTLRCSAPQGEAVSSYQFYNQDGTRVYTESSEPAGGPWLVMTTEVGKAGTYNCEYWAVRDGQNLYSARSQPVRVPVMDLPAAPSISATASGPWDEFVTIACSLPGSYVSLTFQMFKNGDIIKLGVTPALQGTRLQLHTSDPAIAGSYTCGYEADVAGRKVQSRPSSPVSIQLPASPGAPSLSLNPSRTVYLPGETVTLTCSVSRGAYAVTGFQFSRDDDWRVSSRSSNTHALIVTGPGDSGSYTCAYWIRPSQWGVRSQESQPVSISVTAPPPPPRLALDPPQPVYLRGERLALRCMAPPADGKRRYRFFKQSGGQHPEELSAAGESDRLDLGPQMGTGGGYTCGYWVLWSKRWVSSDNSPPVAVSLTDPPPRPALSVDPPSGAVSEGLPLLITCTAPGEAAERRFRFYKDGAEIPPGAAGSELSPMEPGAGAGNVSVLRFPRAGLNSTGEFTCGYEENVRGRWVPSPKSRAANVTLTGTAWPPLIPLIAGGVGAAAFLPLLLLVCLCRRKKDGVTAKTEPIYINTAVAGLALQQRSPDGRAQPETHDRAARPSTPRGKPLVGGKPQRRGKRGEDPDSRAGCNPSASIAVYSKQTFPRSMGQQREGNSEAVVYSEILA